MAISDEKPSSSEDVTLLESDESWGKIEQYLRLTGHHTCSYPNGFTVGVRLEPLPETRGVHAEVIFVLDLRIARFGNTGLAMQAAVLETVTRDLQNILADVGLGDRFTIHKILTPTGRLALPVLLCDNGTEHSLLHETRTVYVVTKAVRPSIDFSWLTDPRHVIPAEEFVLTKRSDSRAKLANLTNYISSKKWMSLKIAIASMGWGLFSLLFAMVSGLLFAYNLSNQATLPLFTSLSTILSAFLSFFLLGRSVYHSGRFKRALQSEIYNLNRLCDMERFRNAIEKNASLLELIGTLNFSLSPLMVKVSEYLEKNDIDSAIEMACSIIDECIRTVPDSVKNFDSEFTISDDAGINHFVGLFDALGISFEREQVALVYVALTNHIASPLSTAEAIHQLGTLNNHLFAAGMIRPSIKERVDDALNKLALLEAARELSEPPRETEDEFLLQPDASKEVPNSDSDKEDTSPEEKETLKLLDSVATRPTVEVELPEEKPNIYEGGEVHASTEE